MARLLVDMNWSIEWIPLLQAAGHDAVHCSEVGDPRAPDQVLMAWASAHGYAVFTHDLDFGTMLAALRSVFSQEDAVGLVERWDDLAASLAERFPKAAELMAQAREDVLAFRHFPQQHWKKVWSTNLLERVNEEVKRRTRVVGIFPNDAAITRLVCAVLLEQDEHWQLEGRRMFSADSMAAIPALEALPARQDGLE